MLNWIDAVQQSPDLAGLSSLLNEVPLGALPLSGGLTNRAWRVLTPSHGWVIWRANSSLCQSFDISRDNEAEVLNSVAGHLPTNKVIARGPQGIALSWCNGIPVSQLDDHSKVIALLADIHTIQPISQVRRFDYQEKVDHYWSQLDDSVLKRRFRPIYESLRTLPKLSCAQQALCHFDFGIHNLVQIETGLAVIDWEYAAIASPVLDLTMTLDMLQMDVVTGIELYKQHQPTIDSRSWQKDVEIWQRHSQMMAMLWYLLAAQVWQDDGFLVEAEAIYLRLC
ncbi:phosphotransferase [Vibrio mediterranei]|uniref:phosphotransferase n=1 Tax=Vibrio mediterranei TaxID=689 RepID=UPI0038CF09DC